ncbi:MAG: adenylyl-sulfate kinase [Nocardioidaceae bacterium]
MSDLIAPDPGPLPDERPAGATISDAEVAAVVADAAAEVAGVLPDELALLPAVHASGPALDLVELVLMGVAVGGFVLPGDGEGMLPLPLEIPPADAAGVAPGSRVVVEDAEGVPVALLDVAATAPAPGSAGALLAAGPITRLRPLSHGPFRRLRLTPAEVTALVPRSRLAVTTTRPLTDEDLHALTARAEGTPLLVLPLLGHGRAPYPSAVGLVRALRAVLPELPDGSLVVPLPLPRLEPEPRDHATRDAAARAFGVDGAVHLPPASVDELDWLVEQGSSIPEAELEVLRAQRPGRDRRGVVLFLTGLSGSGKSTVAKGVAEAVVESTDRTVTLLDGDVVRRHLSKGLGFSREDRDTNIRRIGFVAAEVARHGGIAICAPIAPYAATRAAVRAMAVEAGAEFVLVHVATPLEVCEARDRKGLYAKARAGLIPEFTGVSDPYEEPDDADLRLDTSTVDIAAAVDLVLAELRGRGLVPGVRREEA